jgi:class 3 adenylate cyclase
MRCPKCEFENPAGMKFCGKCRTSLGLTCPNCSFENPPGFDFCGQCATALFGDTGTAKGKPSAAKPVEAVRVVEEEALPTLDGERKTVTALFADIKGSMELIEDLDPEDARAIVDPALKLMMEAVHRFGGYVAQSTGDGIFALFGAPVAHEDHPQRALFAALRMQEEVKRYAEKLRAEKGINLQVRVGVNTGEVVVRSIKTGEVHTEYAPIGHSTSFASRLQALAAPGSIAISDAVRKLVEGYFTLKALGPTRVKGVSEPVEVYEVTGLGPLRTRLQRSGGRGYTKFVGRQREMEAIKHAAEQAKGGHGQIVATMAEPGVGKSRLLFEFKAAAQSGWILLETVSVSHDQTSVYQSVIDLLHSYFDISSEDDPRTRRDRVSGKILALDRSLEDAVPYVFKLLGVAEATDPLAQMDGQIRERRTLDAIKRILLRESLNQPLMVIFEDLHWIDDRTQALLNLVADSIGNAKILLLVSYRPEYSHQWSSKTYYTQLRLDPLGNESAEEMLSATLGSGIEITPLKRLIIEKTEGNPFFIEELVQAMFDDGALVRNGTVRLAKALSQFKIPPTVQAILASRIDRLPPDQKDLLQTLAVIGREFAYALVQRVVDKPEDELNRMLHDLQLAELIYEQPATGDIEYIFKHALTLEVAYNSVLIEKRRPMHEKIGDAIEALAANRIDDHLAELAHHYSRSHNPIKAARYLNLASLQAQERSAFIEATDLAHRGISILGSAAEGPERDREELGLQITLARSLAPTFSPGFVEVAQAYTRALELCKGPQDGPQMVAAMVGLQFYYRIGANGRRARELSQRLLAIGVQTGLPIMRVIGHASEAASLAWLGQPGEARKHAEESLAALVPEDKIGLHFHFNSSFPALSCSLWLLGFPDRARKVAEEAISQARALNDAEKVLISLADGWEIDRFLRDPVRTKEHAEAAIAIGSERGFRALELLATGHRAWALVYMGHGSEGLEELRHILASRDNFGMGSRPSVLAMLAEAHLELRQPVAGFRALEDALSRVEPTSERMYESELYRLKGELLLAEDVSNAAQAEQSFRTAIDIARKQSAKSWELRATTSLARLLTKQVKRDEARAMLAEIYNWFTEGFDTADLKDAKALLEELSV